MDHRDIEEHLSGLQLKEPRQDLRHRVLLRATSVWEEDQAIRIRSFRLVRQYAYVLVLLLLLSITSSKIDGVLTDRLIGEDPIPDKVTGRGLDMKGLYSDLGLDGERYEFSTRLVQAEQDKEPASSILEYQKQLIEELDLTNGGLS